MKLCPDCGSPEHPSWKAHVFAINTPSAINKAAINNESPSKPVAPLVHAIARTAPKAGAKAAWNGDEERTANRRDRAAYNAYMRVKMREYRAKAKLK